MDLTTEVKPVYIPPNPLAILGNNIAAAVNPIINLPVSELAISDITSAIPEITLNRGLNILKIFTATPTISAKASNNCPTGPATKLPIMSCNLIIAS